jgi:hypothetical protein
MFLRKAAIRPVPDYAVVEERAFESLAATLDSHKDGLQEALDAGYRGMDRRQPALGAWLSEEVGACADEVAQSLGYFLVVTVYLAFEEAFPTRLEAISTEALQAALDTLEADEELRANDPSEVLDSDDVLAMGQPAVLEFIQHHLKESIQQAEEEVDLDDLDRIYRAVLVEVIALSHSVTAPAGNLSDTGEVMA